MGLNVKGDVTRLIRNQLLLVIKVMINTNCKAHRILPTPTYLTIELTFTISNYHTTDNRYRFQLSNFHCVDSYANYDHLSISKTITRGTVLTQSDEERPSGMTNDRSPWIISAAFYAL